MTKLPHLRPMAGGQQRAARMLADELLAKLVGRGSDHAFVTLCERHSKTLHRYCLSILRNEHDAQEALQSTMTQAYAALQARERDVSLRPWLFGIAHNESVTILRKRVRQAEPSRGSDARASDPYAVLEQRARLSQLVADLHALPERQRATLVMRELSGLGMQEIAQALDITAAAAKQSLFEARNSLRDFDRGREMACEEVRSAISAYDRRILRGRRISAHLDTCESCRGYRNSIGVREADLRALVPALPAPAMAAALARMFGLGRWDLRSATTGAANGSGQELLTHASSSALLKIGASVAVLATGVAGTMHAASKPVQAHTRGSSATIATEPHSWAAADRPPKEAVPSAIAGSAFARSAPANVAVASRPTPRLPSPTARRRMTTRQPVEVAGPPTQAAPAYALDTHAVPNEGTTPTTKPTTQTSGSPATTQKGGSAKREKGQGDKGKSPSDEHGPSTEERDPASGKQQEQQGAQAFSERGSAASSHDKGGNENGQPGREHGRGQGAGNDHSEQSGQ
ncbi:MAG TPA: sigma-70 family RNA polymerase sigma factor [Solirubrobacteraceae bacterium]|nr:sigma-70 family RNA polymerase sigma factor [Solirubrobacteraceae bacterium]